MSEVQRKNTDQNYSVKPQCQAKEMTGKQFHYFIVLCRDGSIGKQAAWRCLCRCGTIKRILGSQLRNGTVKSCGCLRAERNKQRSTHKHTSGGTSQIYNSWASINQRCNNPKHPAYIRYGGRGIKMCDRWSNGDEGLGLSGFECFLQDMGERPPGCSLDRFPDNNGDYKIENCRWATPAEQGRNKRNNHIVKYNGESLCLSEMAEKYGMTRALLKGRLKRGWSIEKALKTPVYFNPRWHSKQTPREPTVRKTP